MTKHILAQAGPPLHAVNDNAAQPASPGFEQTSALADPAIRTAFDEGMAILRGRPSLIETIPLDRVVADDPSVGDPGALLADLI